MICIFFQLPLCLVLGKICLFYCIVDHTDPHIKRDSQDQHHSKFRIMQKCIGNRNIHKNRTCQHNAPLAWCSKSQQNKGCHDNDKTVTCKCQIRQIHTSADRTPHDTVPYQIGNRYNDPVIIDLCIDDHKYGKREQDGNSCRNRHRIDPSEQIPV